MIFSYEPDVAFLDRVEEIVKSIKLSNISFDALGIRKLKDFSLHISDRITLIAGHNAIGKSTILGIIANNSGVRSAENKSYFDTAYQSKFEELFYLDESEILPQGNRGHAILNYRIEATTEDDIPYCTNHIKKCNIGKNTSTTIRPRLIPRSEDKEHSTELGIGGDGKMPIPTLYLGMSRMTPIGEFEDTCITKKIIKNIDEQDKKFIFEIFNKIISINKTDDIKIIGHDFQGSKKRSKIPEMNFNSLSISLGQDSVSAIVTALASFNKLKRDLGINYIGGILIIDEIESGLHPKAQMNLIAILKKVAKDLNLQIIATTHSLTIIKSTLKDQMDQSKYDESKDSVIYLQDTRFPQPMSHPTYEKIKNDMLLSIDEIEELQPLKVYFEDNEALYFFEKILKYLELDEQPLNFGRKLKLISASLGCDTLLKLTKADDYFSSVIIILDNDVLSKSTYRETIDLSKNMLALPSDLKFTPSTQAYERNPENILYMFLLDKFDNYQAYQEYWRNCKYTTDYVQENILSLASSDFPNNEAMKKWFNKNLHHFDKMNLVEDWCFANNSYVQKFINEFYESIKLVLQNKVP